MKSTIIFSLISAILSLCGFRDRVLLFPGSTTMMLGFQASYSPTFFFWFFSLFLRLVFSADQPTGKSGDAFDAKRKRQREGWPLAMEWRVKTRVQQSTIKKELFQSFIICKKKKIWEYTLVDMSYLEWNINWKPLIMEYWCLGDGIADRIVTQGLFSRGCFALHQRVI